MSKKAFLLPMQDNFHIGVFHNMSKDVYDKWVKNNIVDNGEMYEINGEAFPQAVIDNDFLDRMYMEVDDEYFTKDYYQLLLDLLSDHWNIVPDTPMQTQNDLRKYFADLLNNSRGFMYLQAHTYRLMKNLASAMPHARLIKIKNGLS